MTLNNIQAYNKIAKNKMVSELFLGTLEIDWDFAKIRYTAMCTEALPLTFLETMVCGIAKLDGKVSLFDLAHIMGLNIENDVKNMKFQDLGETEILLETLKTLNEFGVIISSDNSFSSIELTEIGKEYYYNGRKFKQSEKKGFTMYYDLTSGNHSHAMTLFSEVAVDGTKEEPDVAQIPYQDESFVKQYAESQIPQYYSVQKGNSFTNMEVSAREFLYKKVVLGVIYNSSSETYRFEIIDNGGIDNSYITEHINAEENFNHYLGLFLISQPLTSDFKKGPQIKFEEEIAKVERDAEFAIFNKQPIIAQSLVDNFAKSPDYMEIQNIFNFIKSSIMTGSIKDVFINLPKLTKEVEKEIHTLSEDTHTRIMLNCGDLDDFDSRFGDNVLVLNGDPNSEILFMIEDIKYQCDHLVFSINAQNFNVKFLHKQDTSHENKLEQIRERYATIFIPNALDKYENLLKDTETKDILTRMKVLNSADELVIFSESYVTSTGNDERLATLRAYRDSQLLELVEKHSINLMAELDKLRDTTPLEEINTLEEMSIAQMSFSAIKAKIIPEQNIDKENGGEYSRIVMAFNDSIRSFESKLNSIEVYLHQELLPKTYIIDTNVFVHFPEIMDYIEKESRIILSLRVLEELDKLKVTLNGKDKQNVKKAIKAINYKIRMKSKGFSMVQADTKLLPKEFNKTNPDNLILSVALKYRDRNPFLITNDINFQNRAAAMGISFMGLVDLIPEEVYQSIDFSKSENKKIYRPNQSQDNDLKNEGSIIPIPLANIMKKAYQICKEETEEVLVAKFSAKIKEIYPEFKLDTYGHTKFKTLCEAYPSDIELYKNSNRALCIRLIDSDNKQKANSQSFNLKDLKFLNDEEQNTLKRLMLKMIDEEDSSAPIKDGEIRKAFINISGIRINLKPVRQMRELLSIPSAKQRMNN